MDYWQSIHLLYSNVVSKPLHLFTQAVLSNWLLIFTSLYIFSVSIIVVWYKLHGLIGCMSADLLSHHILCYWLCASLEMGPQFQHRCGLLQRIALQGCEFQHLCKNIL
jgi:hypothetical protein